MRNKVHNVLKVIGRRPNNLGAYLYHAATGVSDSGKNSEPKRSRLKKAFARMRRMDPTVRDEGTHRYSDLGHEDGGGSSQEHHGRGYLNHS
jgi:hypothetical protein